MGVDSIHNRHKPEAPCIIIDLTTKDGQETLWRFIGSGKVRYVHLAPPCGTASLARECQSKERAAKAAASGWIGDIPRPLRSAEFPWGFPRASPDCPEGLTEDEAIKVEAANKLYKFAGDLMKYCHGHGILFSCENPRGSWFWALPTIIEVLGLEGVEDTEYQGCAQGHDRPKWSRWRHNIPALRELQATCPGESQDHKHRPWGYVTSGRGMKRKRGAWATAHEAEYPALLCDRAAAAVAATLLPEGKGEVVEIARKKVDEDIVEKRARLTALGQQQKGDRQLVPEFKDTVSMVLVSPYEMEFALKWKHALEFPVVLGGRTLPKDTRKVKCRRRTCEEGETGAPGECVELVVGFPWSPVEFVNLAKQSRHPYTVEATVPDDIARAVFAILTMGKEEVESLRKETIADVRCRKAKLQAAEAALKERMDPAVAHVLRDKPLLLLREELRLVGWADETLFSDLVGGMPVLGEMPVTGVFPPRRSEPVLSVDELMLTASSAQAAAMLPRETDMKEAELTWQATMAEAHEDVGWLVGPMASDEVARRVGPIWLPVRRFPVLQPTKNPTEVLPDRLELVQSWLETNATEEWARAPRAKKRRLVDDASEFGQNSTVGGSEKVSLEGVDLLMAVAKFWVGCVREDRWVRIVLSTGEVLAGPLHDTWTLEEARQLHGRCADMRHAYKQVPQRPSHAWSAVLAVLDPAVREMRFFLSRTLLFGQSGAVIGVNRVSRALKQLLMVRLLLVVLAYVDDLPHLEAAALGASARGAMKEYMALLGWDLADEADKDLPFAPTFTVLGFQLDLGPLVDKVPSFVLANKVSRVVEVYRFVMCAMLGRRLTPADARCLAGRLQYMNGGHNGGSLGVGLHGVRRRAEARHGPAELDAWLESCLSFLMRYLPCARPRVVFPAREDVPVHVFLDGACEQRGRQVTCGAVCFEEAGPPLYFGLEVPEAICDRWRAPGTVQLIGQAELFPRLLALKTWGHILRGRLVVWWFDNDAARYSSMRGYSPSLPSCRILAEASVEDARLCVLSWFGRVPTASNVADAASRLEWARLLADVPGAVWSAPVVPTEWRF